MNPTGTPLKQSDRSSGFCESRQNLNGTGSVTDDGHVPAAQFDVVIPLSRMPGRSLKRGESRELGDARAIQLTDGTHKDIGCVCLAITGGDVPDVLLFVETGFFDGGLELDEVPDTEL